MLQNILSAAGEYLASENKLCIAFEGAALRNSADPVLVNLSVGGTSEAGTSLHVTCSRLVSLNPIALAQTPQCLRE